MRPSGCLGWLSMLLALAIGCARARSPWAVSPIGHGGPPSSEGPGPRPVGWRAQLMAAPAAQACQPRRERHDLRCEVPPFDDVFAAALPHRRKPTDDSP